MVLCMGAVALPVVLTVLTFSDVISQRPNLDDCPDWLIWLINGSPAAKPVTEEEQRPSLLSGMLTKEGDFRNQALKGLRQNSTVGHSLRALGISHMGSSGTKLLGKTVDERLEIVSKLTPQLEAELLVEDAKEYLHNTILQVSMPWYAVCDKTRGDSHLQAIQNVLKMYPDGTLMPISWYDYIVLGYRSPMHRIEMKIRTARKMAKKIEGKLGDLSKGEIDVKDKLLVQYYVLEQLGALDRYALRKSFFRTDHGNPPECELWYWALGWLVVGGTLLFSLYFSLAWAVSNDSATVQSLSLIHI